VIFNCFESEEAPPLTGKVLLRFLVHNHGYAAGFGVGANDMSVSKDPEHQRGFFGIYHGGQAETAAEMPGDMCVANPSRNGKMNR